MPLLAQKAGAEANPVLEPVFYKEGKLVRLKEFRDRVLHFLVVIIIFFVDEHLFIYRFERDVRHSQSE